MKSRWFLVVVFAVLLSACSGDPIAELKKGLSVAQTEAVVFNELPSPEDVDVFIEHISKDRNGQSIGRWEVFSLDSMAGPAYFWRDSDYLYVCTLQNCFSILLDSNRGTYYQNERIIILIRDEGDPRVIWYNW